MDQVELDFSEILLDADKASGEQRSEHVRRMREAFLTRASRLSEDEIAAFEQVMSKLLDGMPLLERVAFAKSVARSPHLPAGLRRRLLSDNSMVASPVIETAALSEEDLIGLIDPNNEAACLSVARRTDLKMAVSDRLMATGKHKVMLTVARNTRAELSPRSFEILSDIALKGAEMDEALAKRPDLPPDIARKLTRALENRTRERISAMVERDLSKVRKPFVLR